MITLGLTSARVGDRVTAGDEAPPLSGVVERARSGDHAGVLVRLDGPTPHQTGDTTGGRDREDADAAPYNTTHVSHCLRPVVP